MGVEERRETVMWEFTTEGLFHKFRIRQNQLIVECYDYKDYHVGNIKIIINKKEREKLIKKIGEMK